MAKLRNVPPDDASKSRLAALYENKLMDVKVCANAKHKLTREEVILLADKLAGE